MKTLAQPSYHLFRFRDSGYALDIATGTVLHLDESAYDALNHLAAGLLPDEVHRQLSARYSSEVATTVRSELDWLQARGVFRSPLTTYDDRENAVYIQSLTQRSTNKIELYLAEACNLRCRYCYVNANEALNNGLMPWPVAKQAIDFAFARSGAADSVIITFFGGEPLLNKAVLFKAVAYSQQLGAEQGKRVSYSMTTNATLLDDAVIDLIKRYNFGLMVSLDGPREIQDTMRPFADGRGSFEIATRNIRKLMQRRRSVTVRCTLSNRWLDRIRIVQFLEEFGFSHIAMSRCTGAVDGLGPYDIGPEENRILSAQDDTFIDRLLSQLERGEKIRFNPWARAIQAIHNRQNHRMRCGVGRGCTTAGRDGRLYPCHRYVGMDAYVLGDVESGIDQGRFADYLSGYFATKQKCESCWAINLCGGYCPWYVSRQDGTFSPPEDWWCDEIRHWYEQGIWLYDTLREHYPDYFGQLIGETPVEPLLR
ncbi:MAG: radical SAM protein [Anaerolineae bacterium]|nr:radical SAM protein [Anaerolineae bacterium]